jgi:hypothetical protein
MTTALDDEADEAGKEEGGRNREGQRIVADRETAAIYSCTT